MAESARLEAGGVFAGDFRIVRLLAEGGMGAVYVAEQESTGKLRALKVMQSGLISAPKNRERFLLEARVGAKISSDHIVEVVAAGVDGASGMPWLAMELLDGEDLAAMGQRRGRLEASEVLEIFEQLCHALGAAHLASVVHRDLKPENIFIGRSRRASVPFTVKVLDFGIAKILQESRTSATSTAVIGSPLWMAPEQLRLDRIGPAADLWALGLIAFWALTGRYYWKSANQEDVSIEAVLAEKLFDALEPASARAAHLGAGPLPAGFDAWFARAVSRDPGARFADAAALLAALRACLGEVAPRAAGALFDAPPTAAASSLATPLAHARTAPVHPGPREVSATVVSTLASAPPTLHSASATPAAPRRAGARWAVLALAVGALGLVGFLRRRALTPEASLPPPAPVVAAPAPPLAPPAPTVAATTPAVPVSPAVVPTPRVAPPSAAVIAAPTAHPAVPNGSVDLSSPGSAEGAACHYRHVRYEDGTCIQTRPGYNRAWMALSNRGVVSVEDERAELRCGPMVLRRYAGRCVSYHPTDYAIICCR